MPEQEGAGDHFEDRDETPQIKIIAISGGGRFGMTYLLDMAEKLGANYALTKPFGRQELLGAIRALLTD